MVKTPERMGLLNPISTGTMACRFSLVGPVFYSTYPFSFSGFLQIPSLACQVGSPGSPSLLFDMAGLGLGWKSANPHIGYLVVLSKAVLPLVSSHFVIFCVGTVLPPELITVLSLRTFPAVLAGK